MPFQISVVEQFHLKISFGFHIICVRTAFFEVAVFFDVRVNELNSHWAYGCNEANHVGRKKKKSKSGSELAPSVNTPPHVSCYRDFFSSAAQRRRLKDWTTSSQPLQSGHNKEAFLMGAFDTIDPRQTLEKIAQVRTAAAASPQMTRELTLESRGPMCAGLDGPRPLKGA